MPNFGFFALYSFLGTPTRTFGASAPALFVFLKGSTVAFRTVVAKITERRERSRRVRVSCETPSVHTLADDFHCISIVTLRLLRATYMLMDPFEIGDSPYSRNARLYADRF